MTSTLPPIQIKRRVFISFASEDLDHVRGVRLMASNPSFELDFYDQSIKTWINSYQASYIKSILRDKIKRSSITLCLISHATAASEWVEWELAESYRAGNIIVAMGTKDVKGIPVVYPKFIRDNNIFVWAWDIEKLKELLR